MSLIPRLLDFKTAEFSAKTALVVHTLSNSCRIPVIFISRRFIIISGKAILSKGRLLLRMKILTEFIQSIEEWGWNPIRKSHTPVFERLIYPNSTTLCFTALV